MTPREHYRRFVHFEPGLQPPNIDNGPLLATYERWLGEGLRPTLDPRRYDEWCDAFGLDRYPLTVNVALPRQPLYEERVLAETDTTVTKRMSDGSVMQDNKGSHKSIPHFIRPAVTTRDEWERLKAWLNVAVPLPGPENPQVAEAFRRAREATQPVWLGGGSLMGVVRSWLGFEAFAMLAYDDLDWLEDMFETVCREAERQIRHFGAHGVAVDGVHFWEDICFKTGPIINPAHFRALVVPRYRRVVDLAARYGCDRVSVDSDGNIEALLDGWLEGGVTLFWPLEVQAGMDINALQAKYDRRAVWMGGIYKYKLTGGEQAIAKELERIRPAVERGGYLPTLDHCCPPDVSFENYLTYLRLRHEILGLGTRPVDPQAVRA